MGRTDVFARYRPNLFSVSFTQTRCPYALAAGNAALIFRAR